MAGGMPYPLFAKSEREHLEVAAYLAARNEQLRTGRGDSLVNDRRLDDYDVSVTRAGRIHTNVLQDDIRPFADTCTHHKKGR